MTRFLFRRPQVFRKLATYLLIVAVGSAAVAVQGQGLPAVGDHQQTEPAKSLFADDSVEQSLSADSVRLAAEAVNDFDTLSVTVRLKKLLAVTTGAAYLHGAVVPLDAQSFLRAQDAQPHAASGSLQVDDSRSSRARLNVRLPLTQSDLFAAAPLLVQAPASSGQQKQKKYCKGRCKALIILGGIFAVAGTGAYIEAINAPPYRDEIDRLLRQGSTFQDNPGVPLAIAAGGVGILVAAFTVGKEP